MMSLPAISATCLYFQRKYMCAPDNRAPAASCEAVTDPKTRRMNAEIDNVAAVPDTVANGTRTRRWRKNPPAPTPLYD
jgi:hypothetical protein